MANEITKALRFSEGVSVGSPTIISQQASNLVSYATTAAFEAVYGAGSENDIFYNTTDDEINYYANGAWRVLVDENQAQTLTNKVIDADNNTISNLAHGAEVDQPSSNVHGVTGSVVGTSDSQALTNKEFSDAITHQEISTPSTPASTKWKSYFKTDGFYILDDAGAESKLEAASNPAVASTSSATYNATNANSTILCDTTSNDITVNLFTAVGNTGKIIRIKKINDSNLVTVDGATTETMDGKTTIKLVQIYSYLILQSDGTNWVIIDYYEPIQVVQAEIGVITTNSTSATLAATFGTIRYTGRPIELTWDLVMDSTVGTPAVEFKVYRNAVNEGRTGYFQGLTSTDVLANGAAYDDDPLTIGTSYTYALYWQVGSSATTARIGSNWNSIVAEEKQKKLAWS